MSYDEEIQKALHAKFNGIPFPFERKKKGWILFVITALIKGIRK